ncbi:MAG: hypothetical protein KJ587_08015 [Alphaproteobacteria bacterium]|nr:hypothetical protein [Alphaproteobacteria bacterium]
MLDVSLVFIIGTAVSFFPLLRLMKGAGARRLNPAGKSGCDVPVDPDQAMFLATLKLEAFERTAHAIDQARRELELRYQAFSAATGHLPHGSIQSPPDIPSLTSERLRECISLVESLFSRSTAKRFRATIRALESDYRDRKRHWASHASAAVGLLQGELRDGR